jgi:hypothetical protein
MKKNPSPLLLLLLAGLSPVFADPPETPPGFSVRATRADFAQKEKKEQERQAQLDALLPDDTDTPQQKADKEAAKQAIEQEIAAEKAVVEQQKAASPEDFVIDPKSVKMTEAPKQASVHEVAVTQVAVVQAATKVVVRRTR